MNNLTSQVVKFFAGRYGIRLLYQSLVCDLEPSPPDK